jgi:hypothetical protein
VVNVIPPDGTDCYELIFVIVVDNIGERSTAQNVTVAIIVEKGAQYLDGINPEVLIFGDIPPGGQVAEETVASPNSSWPGAPDGTEIKITAIITNEDTRPDHNEGKFDTGGVFHPGTCAPR